MPLASSTSLSQGGPRATGDERAFPSGLSTAGLSLSLDELVVSSRALYSAGLALRQSDGGDGETNGTNHDSLYLASEILGFGVFP